MQDGKQVEMSYAVNSSQIISSAGKKTQLLQDDINPDILNEFNELDQLAQTPNFDQKGNVLSENQFQDKAVEERYLQLMDMVTQNQISKFRKFRQGKENINDVNKQYETAQDFIQDVSETQKLHQIVWGSTSSTQSAYLVEMPGITNEALLYKLYVQESHPVQRSEKGSSLDLQVLYEKNFSCVPTAFGFSGSRLFYHDSETNSIVSIQKDQEESFKLPKEVKLCQDPCASESKRTQMATNLLEYYQSKFQISQKDSDILKQEVLSMSQDCRNQLVVIDSNGSLQVYTNVETKGVIQFVSFSQGDLKVDDLQRYLDSNQEDYSPIALFQNNNDLVIVNYSETQKQIQLLAENKKKKLQFKQPNPVMKIFMEDQKLFILDMSGQVQIIDIQENKQTTVQVGQEHTLCTDIHVTKEALYIQSCSRLGSKQAFMFAMYERKHDKNESMKIRNCSHASFQSMISQKLAKQQPRVNVFSQSLCVDGLILLANYKTLYIKDEMTANTSKWRQHFNFESHIINLFHVEKNTVMCITEKFIHILKVNPDSKEVWIKQSKGAPGKVLTAIKSEQIEWNNCNVLLETCNDSRNQKLNNFQLWSCAPDLEMFLILQDVQRNDCLFLAKDCYFNFIRVDSQVLVKDVSEQKSNDRVALVCSNGKYDGSPQFILYAMPDVFEEGSKIQKSHIDSNQVRPMFQKKGKTIFTNENRTDQLAKCLTFREVKGTQEDSNSFYVALIQWTNSPTDVMIFDSSFNIVSEQEYHGLSLEKILQSEINGHLFAFDNQQCLYAIDTKYLDKNIKPQQVLNFDQNGNDNTHLLMSDQNICLVHCSGLAQLISKSVFEGRKELEEFEKDNYLVWQQHRDLFAAVNRFNVMCIWNTLTGKLMYKERLEGKDRIENAHFYKSHDYQPRFENLNHIFSNLPQIITCVKRNKQSETNTVNMKMIKFNVFDETKSMSSKTSREPVFKALCETICDFQVNLDQLRNIWTPGLGLKEEYEKYAYIYNEELKLMIVAMKIGYIMIYRQMAQSGQWIMCNDLQAKCNQVSSLHVEKGYNLVENHISPDGKYLLSCTNDGLKIFKFVLNTVSNEITLDETTWQLPIETKQIDQIELATRVKFEAHDIVRILTPDNRDILYQLKTKKMKVQYLTELRLENQYHTELSKYNWTNITHKIQTNDHQNDLKKFMQRNSLLRAQYWYHKLLHEQHYKLIQDSQRSLNSINFIAPVEKKQQDFSVQYSFRILDWLLAEQIAANEVDVETLDDKHKLLLSLYIFPKQRSIIHLITEKTSREDQNPSAEQIRQILEAAQGFIDQEVTGHEDPVTFDVPIIANAQDELPLTMMHKNQLRAVSDTLMSYINFRNLIYSQEAAEEIMQQNAPNLIKCLESSIEETESSLSIKSIDLPEGKSLITFRANSATLSAKEIQRMAHNSIKQKEGSEVKDEQLVNTPVNVRILDISWLLRLDKTFMDFAAIVEQFERDNLFNTEFLGTLTNEFWCKYKTPIFYRAFIPWVMYSTLSLVYLAQVLYPDSDYQTSEKATLWRSIAIAVIVLAIYQLVIETMSSCNDFLGHWKSPYNWIDLFMYSMTLYIVYESQVKEPWTSVTWQRNLATFIFIAQGYKVILDWFRLFDELSFYVTLIIRTIVDIRWISLIILILFVYIGSAMYMLQLNVGEDDEDVAVIPTVFGNFFIDLMINQFQLMIGAVEVDSFNEHEFKAIVYILYFAAMVISNITFLNMLIAIMGDTFDRVIDQRPTYSLKNKIMILASYKSLVPKFSKNIEPDVFIYVITPADDENATGEENAWRGKLFYLQNLIRTRFLKNSDHIDTTVTELGQKIQHVQVQMTDNNKQMNGKIDSLQRMIRKLAKAQNVSDDDDQDQQLKSTSLSMSKEYVLATSAGFSDLVQGFKFESDDDLDLAYNKLVNDWQLGNQHNGFNVQHGDGTWSINQVSAIEYILTSSHLTNTMRLDLPLNLVLAQVLEKASTIHFQCSIHGTSDQKDDKYRVSFKLLHNDPLQNDPLQNGQVIKQQNTCGDNEFLQCDIYGNETQIDFEIDLSDIDKLKRSEYVVKVEIAGRDAECQVGNQGSQFKNHKLFMKI